MSLSGLQLVVFLFFAGKSFAGFGDESYPQSDVYISTDRAYLCENTEPNGYFFTDLRNINEDGVKAVTMEFELEDTEFTDKWTAKIDIDKWNNGDWDRNFYNTEDTACETFEKWTPGAWKKFKKQVEPAISESCFINLGRYKITDFEIDQSDIVVPAAVLGKYRVAATVFDANGEEMFCQMAELEIKKQ